MGDKAYAASPAPPLRRRTMSHQSIPPSVSVEVDGSAGGPDLVIGCAMEAKLSRSEALMDWWDAAFKLSVVSGVVARPDAPISC